MNESDTGWRRWGMFAAVSLAFFFLNMATFTALGVVLYTMVAKLHWSLTQAGLSYAVLGVACGGGSPISALAMRWLGGRATLCVGAGLLAIGFLLASFSGSIADFYVAMVVVGLGYSLAGNIPGVILIAGWFKRGAARVIGYYLMLGAFGSAAGAPIAEAIVRLDGWRGQWRAMAVAALGVGVVCFALVRSARGGMTDEADRSANHFAADRRAIGWTPRQAVCTPQFAVICAGIWMTITCVTTLSSDTVIHLVHLGATPSSAAWVLGVMGLMATLLKGAAGRLCEMVPPGVVLAAGLAMQAVGNLLLAHADGTLVRYAGALTFGSGWGLAFVAGTVVMLEYFGAATGSKIMSVVWMMTAASAGGPVVAGMIADRTGSYAPIFNVYALILLVLTVPTLMMREPVPQGSLRAVEG